MEKKEKVTEFIDLEAYERWMAQEEKPVVKEEEDE